MHRSWQIFNPIKVIIIMWVLEKHGCHHIYYQIPTHFSDFIFEIIISFTVFTVALHSRFLIMDRINFTDELL